MQKLAAILKRITAAQVWPVTVGLYAYYRLPSWLGSTLSKLRRGGEYIEDSFFVV